MVCDLYFCCSNLHQKHNGSESRDSQKCSCWIRDSMDFILKGEILHAFAYRVIWICGDMRQMNSDMCKQSVFLSLWVNKAYHIPEVCCCSHSFCFLFGWFFTPLASFKSKTSLVSPEDSHLDLQSTLDLEETPRTSSNGNVKEGRHETSEA